MSIGRSPRPSATLFAARAIGHSRLCSHIKTSSLGLSAAAKQTHVFQGRRASWSSSRIRITKLPCEALAVQLPVFHGQAGFGALSHCSLCQVPAAFALLALSPHEHGGGWSDEVERHHVLGHLGCIKGFKLRGESLWSQMQGSWPFRLHQGVQLARGVSLAAGAGLVEGK